jgi:hypothetical protein
MPIDEIVGDALDRVVSIEMRFASGLPRGVVMPLFDAARAAAGACERRRRSGPGFDGAIMFWW